MINRNKIIKEEDFGDNYALPKKKMSVPAPPSRSSASREIETSRTE